MSAATITFYKARNVSRDDLFSEELHAVNNAGQRFRLADKFRRIPVMAGRHEIGTLIEVRDCGFRYYIAVAADMSGFEFALQFAAPCDATKALAGHLHGFKHACFGGGALRSVKSAVVAHCAQAETVEATEEPAQAETVEVEGPAKVEAEVEFGPFEYEGDGAHCSELTRAGECVGQLVKECDTDDRRVVCYRVRSWSGEIERYFNISAHGTARAALKAARQFAQTLEPAQAETVDVEGPAQAFAPGDAVIATYKGEQAQGVVVREYVCPDHRKGYPDERFYSSPEYPVYVVKVRGKDRKIAYGASHLELCVTA